MTQRSERTRVEITRVAVELVLERGFAAAKIDAIAERAGSLGGRC